jgi:iron complex outermembrane recepter protein
MVSAVILAMYSGLIAGGAIAQQDAPQIEEVMVVGSQIRGARITESLPVSVVGVEEIAATAALSGDSLFRSIPEAGDITFNGTYLSGGNSNAARGDVSTVSLRGLAQGNTLLLLNGRRTVEHPTAQTDNETPVFGYNVNALPVAGLQRVEILKDGAAALYGSDAVAGVVNNVLRDNFTGTEVSIQYGSAEMDEWSASLLTGFDFAQGRGNVSFFAGVTDKESLRSDAFEFTRIADKRPLVAGTPFENNPAFDNRGQGGGWFAGTAMNPATGLPFSGGVRSNGALITDTGGNFVTQPNSPLLPACTYDLGGGVCLSGGNLSPNSRRDMRIERDPNFEMLADARRYNMFTFVNYEISDQVSFFGELGYYTATANSLSGVPGPFGNWIVVPAQNYYNPFGPVGSPNRLPGLNIPDEGLPVRVLTYPLQDFGPRQQWVDNYQYRVLGGLRGETLNWSWESALLYNEANVKDNQEHGQYSLLAQTLARTTPDAYNPFGGGDVNNLGNPNPPSNNSRAAIDPWAIVAVRENNTALTLWDFKVSRADIFRLPAGDVGMAGGIEFRRHEYEDDRDSRQDTSMPWTNALGVLWESDLVGHSPSRDVTGKRNVFSTFVELAVPVVDEGMNIPLMRSFDVQLAARYEDYSDVGSITKPKVAMAWDVAEGVRLRGSWSEGFKAPNLDVVNQQTLDRLLGRRDNYRCEAELRAGRISSFAQCTESYGVQSKKAGNPNLLPEESTSLNYGIVFEPQFLPVDWGSFIFTVDRWSIEQTGIVNALDDQTLLDLDYLLRLQGSSNPAVFRFAPTPAEVAAYAGTGLDPVGRVEYTNAIFENLVPLEVAGIDFGVVYNGDLGDLGNLRVNWTSTKLTKFFQSPDPVRATLAQAIASGVINQQVTVLGAADLIRQNGNPEWKSTLSMTWSRGDIQVGYQGQYVGDVEQPGTRDVNNNPWIVKSLTTHNLYGQYTFNDWGYGTSTVRIGARNLTDKEPPLAVGNFGYLGNIHSPNGRYLYASLTHSF